MFVSSEDKSLFEYLTKGRLTAKERGFQLYRRIEKYCIFPKQNV